MQVDLGLRRIRRFSLAQPKQDTSLELDPSYWDESSRNTKKYAMAPRFLSRPSLAETRISSSCSRGRSVKPVFTYLHQKVIERPESCYLLPESSIPVGSKSSLQVELIPEYQFRLKLEPWYSLTSPPQQLRLLTEDRQAKGSENSKYKAQLPKKKIVTPYANIDLQPRSLHVLLNNRANHAETMKLSRFQELETLSRDNKGINSSNSTNHIIERPRAGSFFQKKSTFKNIIPQNSDSNKEVRFAYKVVLLKFAPDKA